MPMYLSNQQSPTSLDCSLTPACQHMRIVQPPSMHFAVQHGVQQSGQALLDNTCPLKRAFKSPAHDADFNHLHLGLVYRRASCLSCRCS